MSKKDHPAYGRMNTTTKGKTMTQLTPEQQELSRIVKMQDTAWRAAKDVAKIEARMLVEERVKDSLTRRDVAIRRAIIGGVPKSQLCVDSLGTRSPTAITDSLARTEHLADFLTKTKDVA